MNETKKNGVPIITVSVELALQFGYWNITDSNGKVYRGEDYLTQQTAAQELLAALQRIYYTSTAKVTL